MCADLYNRLVSRQKCTANWEKKRTPKEPARAHWPLWSLCNLLAVSIPWNATGKILAQLRLKLSRWLRFHPIYINKPQNSFAIQSQSYFPQMASRAGFIISTLISMSWLLPNEQFWMQMHYSYRAIHIISTLISISCLLVTGFRKPIKPAGYRGNRSFRAGTMPEPTNRNLG